MKRRFIITQNLGDFKQGQVIRYEDVYKVELLLSNNQLVIDYIMEFRFNEMVEDFLEAELKDNHYIKSYIIEDDYTDRRKLEKEGLDLVTFYDADIETMVRHQVWIEWDVEEITYGLWNLN